MAARTETAARPDCVLRTLLSSAVGSANSLVCSAPTALIQKKKPDWRLKKQMRTRQPESLVPDLLLHCQPFQRRSQAHSEWSCGVPLWLVDSCWKLLPLSSASSASPCLVSRAPQQHDGNRRVPSSCRVHELLTWLTLQSRRHGELSDVFILCTFTSLWMKSATVVRDRSDVRQEIQPQLPQLGLTLFRQSMRTVV